LAGSFLPFGKMEIYQLEGVNRVTNKSGHIKGATLALKSSNRSIQVEE